MRSKIRSGVLNLFLSVSVLCALLLLTEFVLRLTVYRFKNYPVSPGPGSVYRIDTAEFKTAVRINRHNLRGPEIPDKREGEYRILCVGDSFTFGLGVNEEDSYPAVLERMLKSAHPQVRVINGSYGRYAKEELEFLLEKEAALKPDLAVVQIYIGNDIYDTMLSSKESRSVRAAKEPCIALMKNFLKQQCVTFDFIWRRLIQIPYLDDWLFRFNWRYNNRAIFLKRFPPFEEKLVAIELDYLKKMDEFLVQNGIRRLYLIVPCKEQIYMKRRLQEGRYDYRKPNKIFEDFLRENHCPFLDLLDAYESLPEGEVKSFYYVQDQHWTPSGNRHAAGAVAEWIRRQALWVS